MTRYELHLDGPAEADLRAWCALRGQTAEGALADLLRVLVDPDICAHLLALQRERRALLGRVEEALGASAPEGDVDA